MGAALYRVGLGARLCGAMVIGALVAHLAATYASRQLSPPLPQGAASGAKPAATPIALAPVEEPQVQPRVQAHSQVEAEPARPEPVLQKAEPHRSSEPVAAQKAEAEPAPTPRGDASGQEPAEQKQAALEVPRKDEDSEHDHKEPEHKEPGEGHAIVPFPAIALSPERTARLAQKGMTAGSPVMIRIFKAESELELWIRKDDRFELFTTYPICRWSGKLGPKLVEGDKQAPEGIYSISLAQTRRKGRWPRSMNIGYPNAYDRAMERTGSLILVHGGCTSTGCYAMTNPVMDEIHALSERALREGQDRIPVHVFPFRMTEANLAAHAGSEWLPFWRSLKPAYDAFERTRVPPRISVCGRRYVVTEGVMPGTPEPALGTATSDPPREDCIAADAHASHAANDDDDGDRAAPVRTRKAESRAQIRRAAGRNVRQNYADARKARMAAHAQRARKQASATARRTQ